MTSNGYAFTHEIIKSAKAWNLEYVQVTFDGLREEHNRRKNFITNDPDPFLHTISNIHCLLEAGVGVSIRLNFDTDNLFQIRDLVDYLANEFKNEKRISFYPVALFEDCSSWRPGRDADEQIRLISEQALLRDYIKNKFRLSQKNVGKGFSMHYCGANSISHRTINPNGTFSVCHNVSDKVIYGSIFDGITDHELYKKWTNNGQPREKCRNCVWLPDCTTFSLCPVKKSYCSIDRESFVKESIIRAYQQWKHR